MSTTIHSLSRMIKGIPKFITQLLVVKFGPLRDLRYVASFVSLPPKSRMDKRPKARIVFGWQYGYVIVRIDDHPDILMVGPNTSYQKLVTELKVDCPLEVPDILTVQTRTLVHTAYAILAARLQELAKFAVLVKRSNGKGARHD